MQAKNYALKEKNIDEILDAHKMKDCKAFYIACSGDRLDGNVSKSERLESIVHKYESLMDHAEIPFYTCQDIRRFYDDFAHEEIKKRRRSMPWMVPFSVKIR